jgi:hypothetical protein
MATMSASCSRGIKNKSSGHSPSTGSEKTFGNGTMLVPESEATTGLSTVDISSQWMKRPPGRSTRASSRATAPPSGTTSITHSPSTPAAEPVSTGKRSAGAWSTVTSGCFFLKSRLAAARGSVCTTRGSRPSGSRSRSCPSPMPISTIVPSGGSQRCKLSLITRRLSSRNGSRCRRTVSNLLSEARSVADGLFLELDDFQANSLSYTRSRSPATPAGAPMTMPRRSP